MLTRLKRLFTRNARETASCRVVWGRVDEANGVAGWGFDRTKERKRFRFSRFILLPKSKSYNFFTPIFRIPFEVPSLIPLSARANLVLSLRSFFSHLHHFNSQSVCCIIPSKVLPFHFRHIAPALIDNLRLLGIS